MHRLLLGLTKGDPLQADHKDHNGLNNRRSNLRKATRQQNAYNRKLNKNNTSGYKGVVRSGKKWLAKLRVDNHYISGGRYETAEFAAQAYDVLARQHFGEFATLNFPNSWI